MKKINIPDEIWEPITSAKYKTENDLVDYIPIIIGVSMMDTPARIDKSKAKIKKCSDLLISKVSSGQPKSYNESQAHGII